MISKTLQTLGLAGGLAALVAGCATGKARMQEPVPQPQEPRWAEGVTETDTGYVSVSCMQGGNPNRIPHYRTTTTSRAKINLTKKFGGDVTYSDSETEWRLYDDGTFCSRIIVPDYAIKVN